jgi:hypothetical protein
MARNTPNRSISFEREVLRAGRRRARKLGFKNSFSAYVNLLVRQDVERGLSSIEKLQKEAS